MDGKFNTMKCKKEELEEAYAKKGHYDKRIFHLLYEHKIIMEERVDYMEKNHYIPQNSGLLEEATALKKEFLLIRF